ncbi:MAG: phosphoesterase, partial [Segetibacter sp.]|nr:phosphoesterase [Segetibacter sp.]
LVISPYSIFNKTIHTNYNQTCMVRTIEQILGIPPMNIIDATALPMFDCFTDKKSSYSYHFIPNKVPLNEMNKPFTALKGKALYYAKLSKASSYKEVDGGDDDNMNRILWFDAKGETKYPAAK